MSQAPLRVAVMQPTFLPWLGYFALMEAVDAFVFLDDVQLDRTSWQTRNRLKAPGGEAMIPVAVASQPSRVRIDEARLSPGEDFRKIRRALQYALGRAPHFGLVERITEEAFAAADGSLARLNIGIIEGIARAAGIRAARLRSSELGLGPLAREERLLAICTRLGAGTYLSPPGSFDYLRDADPFAGSPVALRFLSFVHPDYPQFHPPFRPYMAAVDALAHAGPEGFRDLLRQGLRPDLTRADLEAALAEPV